MSRKDTLELNESSIAITIHVSVYGDIALGNEVDKSTADAIAYLREYRKKMELELESRRKEREAVTMKRIQKEMEPVKS